MLIISYGYTKGETRKFLETKKLVKPTEEARTIDGVSWEQETVGEIVETQGMFSLKEIFFIDHVLSELEPEEIVKNIKNIAESNNLVVFLESEVSQFSKKLEKFANDILTAPPKTEEKLFNVFSLTDALFERDKKKLWLLYERGLAEGMDPEFDIHKILFWGIKMLSLAKNYPSAVSAGISPFVYSKAKRGVSKYKDGEIEKIAQDLTSMVVRARQGEDWEIVLGQFILGF